MAYLIVGRLALVFLPAAALVAAVFAISVGAPLLLASQPNPAPRQPIPFDHQVHVQQVGIDCAFCHRGASSGPAAGVPDVQQCMACHNVIGASNPDIQPLREAWRQQRPIDWVRVHRLPDHTRFDHSAHVQAGVPCSTCHGDVGSVQQVAQVRSLKMNDCVACHQQNSAPTECVTCHY